MLSLHVRYAETDAMGVAHHSAYVVWLEAARVRWLKERGLNYRDLEAGGVNLAVSGVTLDYRTSAKFDDEVVADTRLTEVKSRRLRFEYVLTRPDGTLLAKGSTLHTPMNRAGKVTRVPSEWLERLQGLLEK